MVVVVAELVRRAHHLVVDARAAPAEDAVLVVAHEEGVIVLVERARDLEVAEARTAGVAAGPVEAHREP